MTRRVLIVSPHFPPVNAPDCQRVRVSLPFLREFGWEAHVLAAEAEHVEGFRDPDIVATLPQDLTVTRVRGIPPGFTRQFGFGGLWLRCGGAIARSGEALLRRERFDLVYFSTTIFSAMTLGPTWQQRFGTPYVVDMQDPWVNEYYTRTGVRPPGGRVRYAFAQWQARRSEPSVIRQAGHVIAVSPAYVTALRERYPDVPAERFTVLPFAASDADFDTVATAGIRHQVFDRTEGLRHWVYLGRGGADMAQGLRGLFHALMELRRTDPAARAVRIHFVGTSYAAKGRAVQTIRPLAMEMGVGDVVSEQTDRVPYLTGLSLLRDADVILIAGSDDPSYSASKVYPCVLARRPVLAILHDQCPAAAILRNCRAGEVVPFVTNGSTESLAARLKPVMAGLLVARPPAPLTDWQAYTPYTSREMARVQCEVFDKAAVKLATRGEAVRV